MERRADHPRGHRMKTLLVLVAALALSLTACRSGRDGTDPIAAGTATTARDAGTTTTVMRAGTAATSASGTPTTATDAAGEHADHLGNATSDCSPSGPTLTLTASGTKFDTDCLAAPAGQAFTINFDNKDPIAHNIQILESHSAAEALFDAGVVTGPGLKTLNVPALKAGTFAFHCKIHPGAMSGTFVVK